MNLYTIVTNDERELPVKRNIRSAEVADFLHTTKNNVWDMVCRPRKKSKYKVIVTGRVGFDKKAYAKRYDMTHDRTEYFRQYYLRMKERKVRNESH